MLPLSGKVKVLDLRGIKPHAEVAKIHDKK